MPDFLKIRIDRSDVSQNLSFTFFSQNIDNKYYDMFVMVTKILSMTREVI